MILEPVGVRQERTVTPVLGSLIKKWAQPNWNPEVVSYPSGICETCRKQLINCEKRPSLEGSGSRERWQAFKLENISVTRGQLSQDCSCPICIACRSNPVGKKGFNQAKTMQKQIFMDEPETGIPHPCTKSSRKKLLAELITKEEGCEQIVSQVIKNLSENKVEKEELRLKQMNGGNCLIVSLGKRKGDKSGIVDAELAAKVKKSLDLSKRDTKKCSRFSERET